MRQGLLTTLIACVVTASCSATPGDAVQAPPVTQEFPVDPVPMVLPTTGAETRWTQGLRAFTWRIGDTVTRACARDGNVALPDAPPPMFVRFFGIPDLEFIRAHGFAGGSAPAVAQGGEPDAVRQRQCVEEGRTAVRPLELMYSSLQQQWFDAVSAIDANDQVSDAFQGFTECLWRRGVRVRDEYEFFAFLESQVNAVDGQESADVERKLAIDYVTCMAPVESVRHPLREQRRREFVRAHAPEIEILRQTLLPAIRDLEARFTIPITFPAV